MLSLGDDGESDCSTVILSGFKEVWWISRLYLTVNILIDYDFPIGQVWVKLSKLKIIKIRVSTGKTQRDRVEREWEGGSGWGIHVNPWLIHVNLWQKPLQYCKVISLQLIKINEKKDEIELWCFLIPFLFS